jgi:hypothetical protein
VHGAVIAARFAEAAVLKLPDFAEIPRFLSWHELC